MTRYELVLLVAAAASLLCIGARNAAAEELTPMKIAGFTRSLTHKLGGLEMRTLRAAACLLPSSPPSPLATRRRAVSAPLPLYFSCTQTTFSPSFILPQRRCAVGAPLPLFH